MPIPWVDHEMRFVRKQVLLCSVCRILDRLTMMAVLIIYVEDKG